MNKESFDQLMQRLDAVGAKLGQAGTAVWGYAVRQIIIYGVIHIVWGFLVLIAMGYVCRNRKKWIELVDESNKGETRFGTGVLVAVLLVIALVSFTYGISELLNPQFHVIKDLIDAANPN